MGKMYQFKPKHRVVKSQIKKSDIPPSILNDPDPRTKDLYVEAYGYVRRSRYLKNMSTSQRLIWVQGFMNGSVCYRDKFGIIDQREAAMQLQLDQMTIMKEEIDRIAANLEKNYGSKDIHAAKAEVSVECSDNSIREKKGTEENKEVLQSD